MRVHYLGDLILAGVCVFRQRHFIMAWSRLGAPLHFGGGRAVF